MIPVIIGVADIKNRSTAIEDAQEPATLMLRAINDATLDATGAADRAEKLRSSIDSIDVVRTWTWPYADLPSLLANKLGAQLKNQSYSEHGGNQPAKLLDEAAWRIAVGETKVAVVTGGEALASCKNWLLLASACCYMDQVDPDDSGCVRKGRQDPSPWMDSSVRVHSECVFTHDERTEQGCVCPFVRFGLSY